MKIIATREWRNLARTCYTPNCGAELEIEQEDVNVHFARGYDTPYGSCESSWTFYAVCPECRERILISEQDIPAKIVNELKKGAA